MRLLVVEDNEELAELLAKGLRTAGYQVDVLSTVEEATSVLLTTFYAALILDLGLPDGDGLTLLGESGTEIIPFRFSSLPRVAVCMIAFTACACHSAHLPDCLTGLRRRW